MRRALAVVVLAIGTLALPRVEAQRPAPPTGTPAELTLARERGLAHLRTTAERHGIAPEDLTVSRTEIDGLSMAHTRVQQVVRGVPVFGGEAIAHFRPDGELFAETDNLVPGVIVDTTPRLSAAAAIDIAVADYGCSDCLTGAPVADLWVLREGGADRLVYRVRLRRVDGTADTALPVRFVDAHLGYVVMAYDDLQTATGSSLYSGIVTIGTSQNVNLLYYMENLVRRVGTFDLRSATSGEASRFSDPNDVWVDLNQRAGVDAHYGSERFLDYLQSVHGRNGIDGIGGPFWASAQDSSGGLISAIVHYGSMYNDAFWDSIGYVAYGDGDGVLFSPLVTLDIAAHEMTHGVTQYTAGLVYQGESGALNESWSDVFGAMLERHVRGESADTWLMGEDAYTPATPDDSYRYMDDPHRAIGSGLTADDDPDHYTERYLGTEDNGGVHVNSGIANKAFYLLAKGGAHHLGGSMTGIGADDAARIWFLALTSYTTSSTNFLGARTATLSAATALFGSGSTQHLATAAAWCLVGVGVCAEVAAISVTPNTGTGLTQAFTLEYSDTLGAADDLASARVRFAVGNVAAGSCTVRYNAITGAVGLQDNAGTAWLTGVLGSGALANSQCTVDLATSTATPNGNTLTLGWDITFSATFSGAKDIRMTARSAGGQTSGWQVRGTWTVPPPTLSAVSVTPNSGTGLIQAFTLEYSDSAGATADLSSARVRFAVGNVAAGSCTVRYNAMTGAVGLLDDAGVAWTAGTLGSATPIANSQCTVNLATSTATPNGNTLTLVWQITFSATFTGAKDIRMMTRSAGGTTTGWVVSGTWTVPPLLEAISVTPDSGAGLTQAFTLAYVDQLGATADLSSARVRFAVGNVAAGSCTARYNAMTGAVGLLNDAGTAWTTGVLGSGTLANSQCTLNLAGSTATPNGVNLTLVLDITFSGMFTGPKDIRMMTRSAGGTTTGWLLKGTWTPSP